MSFQSAAENLEELLADLRLLPALSWDKLPTLHMQQFFLVQIKRATSQDKH